MTENGFAVKGEDSLPIEEAIKDHDRVEYFRGATDSLFKAIFEDGVDIRSYFPWSFLDNFEWYVGIYTRPTCAHPLTLGLMATVPDSALPMSITRPRNVILRNLPSS